MAGVSHGGNLNGNENTPQHVHSGHGQGMTQLWPLDPHHGDVWGQQTYAQLAHQYPQSMCPACVQRAVEQSDMAPENGYSLSYALNRKLAEENLLEIKVLLRGMKIRTLEAFQTIDSTERALLLCKSRQLYDLLLGICPSHIRRTLNKHFGVQQEGVLQANPWGAAWHAVAAVPESHASDTFITRFLDEDLQAIVDIVGMERVTECIRKLRRSDELNALSCMEAAEGLAQIYVWKQKTCLDDFATAALKDAEAAVRNIIIWRLVGLIRGPDSKDAVHIAATNCCRYTDPSGTTVSALLNGFRRLMEWQTTGEPPKRWKDKLQGKLPIHKKAKAKGSSSSGGGGDTTASQNQPKTVAACSVPTGPSSSDPAAQTHSSSHGSEQGSDIVQPSFDAPPELESSMQTFPEAIDAGTVPEAIDAKLGAGSEDGGHSLQLSEIKEMMKAMSLEIQEVKSQVSLQAQLMQLMHDD